MLKGKLFANAKDAYVTEMNGNTIGFRKLACLHVGIVRMWAKSSSGEVKGS